MKLVKNNNDIRIPKLYLAQEILSEISYCHHKVGNKEWSGILLYKFEDPNITIEDLYNTKKTEEVKITAYKFLLRDIGSHSLTEFESSTEEMMEQFEYVEQGYKCGLIHTH